MDYNYNEISKPLKFDAGFIVYNDKNYPNFSKLLDYFKVKTINSNMSFSVSYNKNKFEYGTRSIISLSNGFNNIFSSKIWTILYDLRKFYRESKIILDTNVSNEKNVEEFLIE